MTRDPVPSQESLAEQAASWVPPWQREQPRADAPEPPVVDAEPEPVAEPAVDAEAVVHAEPAVDAESEPIAEPEAVAEPAVDAEAVVDAEPAVDAEADPIAEPAADVESTADAEDSAPLSAGLIGDMTQILDQAEPAGSAPAPTEGHIADLSSSLSPSDAATEPDAEAPSAEVSGAEVSETEQSDEPAVDETEVSDEAAPSDEAVAEEPVVPAQAAAPAQEQAPLPEPAPPPEEAVLPTGMGERELMSALEAILMVVDEPVGEIMLAQVLEQPADVIALTLRAMSREYAEEGRGFDLRQAAGGWRFYTRDRFASYVERFVLDGQSVRLTQAALETLAVVAYKQPVTRSRISAIRGVNCDGVVRTLLGRGLIEECGSEPESGAHLYRTTGLFLEKLGLDSVDQLPPLAPFLPDNVEEIADADR